MQVAKFNFTSFLAALARSACIASCCCFVLFWPWGGVSNQPVSKQSELLRLPRAARRLLWNSRTVTQRRLRVAAGKAWNVQFWVKPTLYNTPFRRHQTGKEETIAGKSPESDLKPGHKRRNPMKHVSHGPQSVASMRRLKCPRPAATAGGLLRHIIHPFFILIWSQCIAAITLHSWLKRRLCAFPQSHGPTALWTGIPGFPERSARPLGLKNDLEVCTPQLYIKGQAHFSGSIALRRGQGWWAVGDEGGVQLLLYALADTHILTCRAHTRPETCRPLQRQDESKKKKTNRKSHREPLRGQRTFVQ